MERVVVEEVTRRRFYEDSQPITSTVVYEIYHCECGRARRIRASEHSAEQARTYPFRKSPPRK